MGEPGRHCSRTQDALGNRLTCSGARQCAEVHWASQREHVPNPSVVRMPVSVSASLAIYSALKANSVTLVSALPETWLVHLIRMAEDDPDMTLVRLAKEEEGVGISTGAHLAGARSVMLMQNHGFLQSVNGIVSCAQLYRIPLVMLISHRGWFGERDPWQTEGGLVTIPVLDALRIPYETLESLDNVARHITKAFTLANAANRPVAVLLGRDLMWEEA